MFARIFDILNQFSTFHLLKLFKCEHYLPQIETFFTKYHLGRLWDHLPAVLVFYVFFAVSSAFGSLLSTILLRQKLAQMDPQKRIKTRISWAHHVVACIHAIIISVMGIVEVFRTWGRPLAVGTHEYYPEVARILSIGLGFFIWDVQICFKYYSIYGPTFAVHAVMAVTALAISFRPYMMNLIPYFMLVEISTVFLHLNWFLMKMGLEGSPIQKFNNGILLLTYFIIRIVLAPIFVYETIRQNLEPGNSAPLPSKIIYCANVVILGFLSQYWFWKLAYRTFVSGKKIKLE